VDVSDDHSEAAHHDGEPIDHFGLFDHGPDDAGASADHGGAHGEPADEVDLTHLREVLAGRRQMPSAEVLEAREHFNLVSREIGDDGLIHAVIRNDGPELEGNFFVPRDQGGPRGRLTLVVEGVRRVLESAVLVVIPPGGLIEFVYPAYAERVDG